MFCNNLYKIPQDNRVKQAGLKDFFFLKLSSLDSFANAELQNKKMNFKEFRKKKFKILFYRDRMFENCFKWPRYSLEYRE